MPSRRRKRPTPPTPAERRTRAAARGPEPAGLDDQAADFAFRTDAEAPPGDVTGTLLRLVRSLLDEEEGPAAGG
jgi:hypothetical protein